MMIGNAEYQCSCVRYMPKDDTALIVGLSVAAGFLLVVAIIIINIIVLRRRRKTQRPEESQPEMEEDFQH